MPLKNLILVHLSKYIKSTPHLSGRATPPPKPNLITESPRLTSWLPGTDTCLSRCPRIVWTSSRHPDSSLLYWWGTSSHRRIPNYISPVSYNKGIRSHCAKQGPWKRGQVRQKLLPSRRQSSSKSNGEEGSGGVSGIFVLRIVGSLYWTASSGLFSRAVW